MAVSSPLWGLRVRLLLVVLVCSLCPLSFSLWQWNEHRQQVSQDVRRHAMEIAQRVAALPKSIVPDPRSFLENLAQRPELAAGGDSCNAFVEAIVKSNPYVTNIKVISTKGREVCSALREGRGADMADRSYFKRAVATRSFAIGDYMVGHRTKKPVLVFAQPLFDSAQEVSGVVSMGINLDWLSSTLQETVVPRGTIVSLLDANGVLLAGNPARLEDWGQPIKDLETARPIIGRAQSDVSEETSRGLTMVSAYLPLYTAPSGRVLLRVQLPKEAVIAPEEHSALRATIWIWILSAAAAVLAWFVGDFLLLRRLPDSADPGEHYSAAPLLAPAPRPSEHHQNNGRMNRALSLSSAVSRAILHSEDEQSLLIDTCRLLVTVGDYTCARIVYGNRPGREAVVAQWPPSNVTNLHRSAADPQRFILGLARSALARGDVVVKKDSEHGAAFNEHRSASFIALRLAIDATLLGAVIIGAAERNAFADREIAALGDVANDLAQGIVRCRQQVSFRGPSLVRPG